MVEMEEGSVRKESGEYDINLFNASSRIYCQLCEIMNVIMMR